MTESKASPRLFIPTAGELLPANRASVLPQACARSIEIDLQRFVSQPSYPCVAAVAAMKQKDYLIGIYEKFGAAHCWEHLRTDLLYFLERQKTLKAPFLSFFAVFQPQEFGEEDFEAALWNELSNLTSEEERATDWQAGTSQDPADKSFLFSIGGSAFFVVGLHSNASRKSRRFRYPTLIFNVFQQFTDLQKANKYEAMVKTNRSRELKFEGSTNPMAALHGETWETIQFSGKSNDPSWGCPFQFLKKTAKFFGSGEVAAAGGSKC